jgi:pilus assembly protein CpaE
MAGCRSIGINVLRALRWDERGAAALELSLLAPVLGAVLLLTVDVGLAVNSRMSIDHVMRVGAETAMADPGESTVQKVLEQAADQNFGTVVDLAYAGSMSVDSAGVYVGASRFCACPESRAVAIACTATCSGKAPLAFYRLEARKTYSGILLSGIEMDTALQVQVN